MERNFDYVLLRHAQSDCIERRFGWYRQLNGANYYASVRQFVEAEKTIRLKSLIKFNNFSMTEIKKVFSETNSTKQKEIDSDAACFIESLNFQLKLETISTEDNAILFYISGYIARSIKKTSKCTSCCRLLVKDNTVPTVNIEDATEDCVSDDKESFFHEINRGGLCYPSDILFIATIHAYKF